ncbi:uncharacterized protein [Solanum lycopersicum]|uniref:uncharacterized protein n=1 Tax=Solanum lycopersicum TaxID=4081 RepID=UPI003749053B
MAEDLVLLDSFGLPCLPGKIKSKWIGPNLITQVFPHGAVELRTKEGVRFKAHHQEILQKITLQQSPTDTCEKKYKTEDARMKKIIVANFLKCKMKDSKTVVTQVQELHVIIHDLFAEGLVINDAFQVIAIIEKLPPLWKDFKNYLKYKCKEMTIEDLFVRSRIEEDINVVEKRSRGNSTISGVNIVEEDPTKLNKRKKTSGLKGNPPLKKFNGSFFNCEKCGHKATECWGPKKDKKKKDTKNFVEYRGEIDDLCAMISECNLVDYSRECTYRPEVVNGKLRCCKGGRNWQGPIKDDIRQGPVLTKNGFKCVFVSDKVVVSEKEMQYKTEVENKLDRKIKMIRSDRGREYESPFAEICLENEIIDQATATYTPQSNEIAEGKN